MAKAGFLNSPSPLVEDGSDIDCELHDGSLPRWRTPRETPYAAGTVGHCCKGRCPSAAYDGTTSASSPGAGLGGATVRHHRIALCGVEARRRITTTGHRA